MLHFCIWETPFNLQQMLEFWKTLEVFWAKTLKVLAFKKKKMSVTKHQFWYAFREIVCEPQCPCWVEFGCIPGVTWPWPPWALSIRTRCTVRPRQRALETWQWRTWCRPVRWQRKAATQWVSERSTRRENQIRGLSLTRRFGRTLSQWTCQVWRNKTAISQGLFWQLKIPRRFWEL